jgi:two-component system, chemotaxis family, protein-glutamate methylesterase/glutaminase
MEMHQKGEPKHIIVIGTSAGGLSALNELVRQLDPSWDAAYFIVLHLSRKGISDFLLHRLQHYTSLQCKLAAEDLPIQKGCIYIAIPNHHLILKKGVVKLGHGPEENRWRPAIDVLFRSAAAAYDSRTTGIILTGLMDDGTSGMWAIKRSGGSTIVQDPNEAEYPDMPLSVLNRMEVDHCVSLAEMGGVIKDIIENKELSEDQPIPPDVIAEAAIAERMATGIDIVQQLGKTSVYTCPDCGGILTEMDNNDKVQRYRCHTGHSYTQDDLMINMAGNIESTLWVALRMMEERKSLLRKMEQQTSDRGFARFAKDQKEKAAQLQKHIDMLKQLLSMSQHNNGT